MSPESLNFRIVTYVFYYYGKQFSEVHSRLDRVAGGKEGGVLVSCILLRRWPGHLLKSASIFPFDVELHATNTTRDLVL